MENSRSVGSRYEAVAAEYLQKEGYRILAKNFRSRFGEIDIVAEEEPYLVFVEVKYRTKQSQGILRRLWITVRFVRSPKRQNTILLKREFPWRDPFVLISCRFFPMRYVF